MSATLAEIGANSHTQIAAVGDFNIDQCSAFDESRVEPSSLTQAREMLANWCSECSLEVALADEWLSWPGGNADPCDLTPYTRFPNGALAELQRPSILDYGCVSKDSFAKMLD